MSAPDHDDPQSRLQLRLRPMRGSEKMAAWASVVGGLGAGLCLLGFIASFLPGVESSGSPLWFLVGAAAFAGVSGLFHLARKLVRRLR
jgi:hypothetical protein